MERDVDVRLRGLGHPQGGGMKFPKIQHPDWLQGEKIAKDYDLYRRGLIPDSIAGFMLATPLKHDLRAIYGGHFRASWALFMDGVRAVRETIHGHLYRFWRYRVQLKSQERDFNEMLDPAIEDEE
jgi:hypothetical protein